MLPTWVNFGLMPAIYGISEHCRPVSIQISDSSSAAPASSLTPAMQMPDMAMHDHMGMAGMHAMSGMEMSMDMGSMSKADMAMPQVADASPKPDATAMAVLHHHDDRVHAVMALAAKIMKTCPLCSHGLEGGLLPALAMVWLLLVLLLMPRVSLIQTIYRQTPHITTVFFRPQPQAPPVFS